MAAAIEDQREQGSVRRFASSLRQGQADETAAALVESWA
jgi:hypothetical protein